MPVSFADPALADVPLIYVNDAFCTLTGYAREECVGRNCRFLQGRLTRTSEASVIREGIEGEHFLLTRLLNYHRDGTPFDNALQIGPASRHQRRRALPVRSAVGHHPHPRADRRDGAGGTCATAR